MAVLEDGGDAASSGGEDWRIGLSEVRVQTGLKCSSLVIVMYLTVVEERT